MRFVYVPSCDGVCDGIGIEGGQGSGVVADDHCVVRKDLDGVPSGVEGERKQGILRDEGLGSGGHRQEGSLDAASRIPRTGLLLKGADWRGNTEKNNQCV